jgi:hypothetical protein
VNHQPDKALEARRRSAGGERRPAPPPLGGGAMLYRQRILQTQPNLDLATKETS